MVTLTLLNHPHLYLVLPERGIVPLLARFYLTAQRNGGNSMSSDSMSCNFTSTTFTLPPERERAVTVANQGVYKPRSPRLLHSYIFTPTFLVSSAHPGLPTTIDTELLLFNQ